ncbi:MAG: metal-dependent hydrolase [Deferribacteres bacterium]|nr:metal-dependent hydrolase [candidate division KSB1 bacterium]MCB9501214.1 metal-dependent hydrolase [Deferribacteres bacterium]
MFIGHFALGFAAKKWIDDVSLGWCFIASQFIDLLWPVLLLLGIESVAIDPGNTKVTPLNFEHYPVSHSLFGVLIWASLFALLFYIWKRNWRYSVLLGGLVMSHWFLDFLTHRPDLPLLPSLDLKVGLGLWNSFAGTVAVEGSLFIAGVYLYHKATRAMNKTGSYALWGLIVFLVCIYIMNLFGSPPPSAEPIAYVTLSMWILVAWGFWIDRNREFLRAHA